MITGSALTPLRESVSALPAYPAKTEQVRRGIQPAGKCPVSPALEGGVKGHNIIRKVPYREATPFRALSFTGPSPPWTIITSR